MNDAARIAAGRTERLIERWRRALQQAEKALGDAERFGVHMAAAQEVRKALVEVSEALAEEGEGCTCQRLHGVGPIIAPDLDCPVHSPRNRMPR